MEGFAEERIEVSLIESSLTYKEPPHMPC